jgi:hypothetical protein
MSIAGAQACSFFDDNPLSATYGVVVQFNRITENSSFYTKGMSEKDFRGNLIYSGDESRLEIEAFDYTGKMQQLKDWEKAGTPLKFVLAGVQENILWYEETTIQVEEPKSFATKTRNVIKVRMEADGGEHNIWSGINILHGALLLEGNVNGWADGDSNQLADGFSEVGTVTNKTFASGVQTIEGSAGAIAIEKKIKFPISGVALTLSINFNSVTIYSDDLRVTILDSNDTLVTTKVQVVDSIDRHFLNITGGLGSYSVLMQFLRVNSIASAISISGSDPALRIDKSEEYTEG